MTSCVQVRLRKPHSWRGWLHVNAQCSACQEYGISTADFHAEYSENKCMAVLAFPSHRVSRSMVNLCYNMGSTLEHRIQSSGSLLPGSFIQHHKTLSNSFCSEA